MRPKWTRSCASPSRRTGPCPPECRRPWVRAYLNLQTGFGFEFLIPSEDDLDIRIPLTFRGSFNFDTDEAVAGRLELADVPMSNAKYVKSINTEWQYQAFVTLGVTFNEHVD